MEKGVINSRVAPQDVHGCLLYLAADVDELPQDRLCRVCGWVKFKVMV